MVETRRRKTLAVGAGVFAAAILGLIVFLILVLFQASAEINNQAKQVGGLAGAVDSLRAQVTSLGATPVAPAPSDILKTVSVPGPAGASGPAGPGPSDTQVQAAVAAYLAAHPVPGVSTQEVATAVDAYFRASPPPSGPAGPGPSQQQIADAVASYMAQNPAPSGPAGPAGSPGVGATGPQGDPGPPGQNGAAGSAPAGWSYTDPSGVSYTCVPDGGTPAPHYTCAPVAPSSSPTDTSSPTVSAGANPADATRTVTPASAAPSTPAPSTSPTTGPPSPSPSPTPSGPSSPLSRILLGLGVPVLRRDDLYIL